MDATHPDEVAAGEQAEEDGDGKGGQEEERKDPMERRAEEGTHCGGEEKGEGKEDGGDEVEPDFKLVGHGGRVGDANSEAEEEADEDPLEEEGDVGFGVEEKEEGHEKDG